MQYVQNEIKCTEKGIFCSQLRLSCTGYRTEGDKKVIGEFENGVIDDKNHFILEQDYSIVDVKEMRLENDAEGRTELKFSGKTFMKKPISNKWATLKYQKGGIEYKDDG